MACVFYEVMMPKLVSMQTCLTVSQIFSGEIPFHEIKYDAAVIAAVAFGNKRPTRPEPELCRSHGLDNFMWGILGACWRKNPKERPTSSDIVKAFELGLGGRGDGHPLRDWDDSFIALLRANLAGGAFFLSIPDIDVTKEGPSFNFSSGLRREIEMAVVHKSDWPAGDFWILHE